MLTGCNCKHNLSRIRLFLFRSGSNVFLILKKSNIFLRYSQIVVFFHIKVISDKFVVYLKKNSISNWSLYNKIPTVTFHCDLLLTNYIIVIQGCLIINIIIRLKI